MVRVRLVHLEQAQLRDNMQHETSHSNGVTQTSEQVQTSHPHPHSHAHIRAKQESYIISGKYTERVEQAMYSRRLFAVPVHFALHHVFLGLRAYLHLVRISPSERLVGIDRVGAGATPFAYLTLFLHSKFPPAGSCPFVLLHELCSPAWAELQRHIRSWQKVPTPHKIKHRHSYMKQTRAHQNTTHHNESNQINTHVYNDNTAERASRD